MAENKQFDTVIVGLGETGFSCARYLAGQGVSFAVTDSRKDPPMLQQIQKILPDVPLYTGGFNGSLMAAANNLLVSPGVSLKESEIIRATDLGVAVYGDVELFCRHASAPIIAVTGSNGKSTVTALVTEMLRADHLRVVAGGNLGRPALDLLSDSTPDFYVLELSSFQLETLYSLNAVAAVVLNICSDHMDRHSNLEEYTLIKRRIYDGTGVMVINRDDIAVKNMIRPARRHTGFTLYEPNANDYGIYKHDGVLWIARDSERLIAVNDLSIAGDHNVMNAMAAMALASSVNCSLAAILNALRSFIGLKHRCQHVLRHNNIDWVNDSKGTNVGATCTAVRMFSIDQNLILIAGGTAKGADFSLLRETAKGRLKAAVLIGKDGKEIAQALTGIVQLMYADSLYMAVEIAARTATAGDVVLLSPACASQDMFTDYRQRGESFINAVNHIVAGRVYA